MDVPGRSAAIARRNHGARALAGGASIQPASSTRGPHSPAASSPRRCRRTDRLGPPPEEILASGAKIEPLDDAGLRLPPLAATAGVALLCGFTGTIGRPTSPRSDCVRSLLHARLARRRATRDLSVPRVLATSDSAGGPLRRRGGDGREARPHSFAHLFAPPGAAGRHRSLAQLSSASQLAPAGPFSRQRRRPVPSGRHVSKSSLLTRRERTDFRRPSRVEWVHTLAELRVAQSVP